MYTGRSVFDLSSANKREAAMYSTNWETSMLANSERLLDRSSSSKTTL